MTAVLVIAALLLQIDNLATPPPAQQPLALAYYSNETVPVGPPAENTEALRARLLALDTPKARLIAAQLRRDQVAFPAAVERDQIGLEALARNGIPSLAATNTSWRSDYWTLREGKGGRPVGAPRVRGDPILREGSPAATSEGLSAFLGAVNDHFPPDTWDVILIIKSHGRPDRVLTPRVGIRADRVAAEELAMAVAGSDRDSLATLNPEWGRRPGISAAELQSALERAPIDTVFVSSCWAGQSVGATSGVRELWVARNSVDYDGIDLAALAGISTDAVSVREALRAMAQEAGLTKSRPWWRGVVARRSLVMLGVFAVAWVVLRFVLAWSSFGGVSPLRSGASHH